MDPETAFEAIKEILGNEQYRNEAESLFIEEINACEELARDEKDKLIDLVVTSESKGVGDEAEDPRIKEIVSILVKSESFRKYCIERYE